MNCPGCNADAPEVEEESDEVHACEACGGVRIGASELNRLLLHNNLPGIESLGGKRVKDAAEASCRRCQVDMTRFEGGDRHDPEFYEICEECGCIFIAPDSAPEGDALAMEKGLVAFFRIFSAKQKSAAR